MSNMSLDYVINLMEGTFDKNMKAAQQKTQQLDNTLRKVAGTAAALFSIQAGWRLVEQSTQAAARLEALDVRLKTVSSSTQQYNDYAAAVADNVKKLKLPIEEATNAFGAFAASTRGTGIEGQKTIDIFRGFSTAGRGMKLSSAQMSSALTAIEQMMTKGQVRSQEMVLQLGNAMPGALNEAAKAIGVTKTEFSKMMEQGKVDAERFLPVFAAHLENLYGPGVKDAVNSLQAKMVDLENQTVTTMAKIGESTQGVYFAWLNIKLKLLNVLVYALQVYENNKTLINTLVVAITTMIGALMAYKIAMQAAIIVVSVMNKLQLLYRAYTLASTIATGGLKAAWIALNAVFIANPIGLIITLIAGLVAGLVYAYKSSDTFRASLAGLGEVGLSVLAALYNGFKLLMAPIRVAVGFLTAGPAGAKEAMEAIKNDALSMAKATSDIFTGASFRKGFDASMAKNKPKPGDTVNALDAIGDNKLDLSALNLDANITGTGGGGSVSAGRSVRNISVRIDKQIFDLNVHTATMK